MCAEQPSGRERGLIAESGSVQMGTHHEFEHVAARGQRGQGHHEGPGPVRIVVVQGCGDHSVQHMRVHPLVAVGYPIGPKRRLIEPLHGGSVVTPAGVEQTETAGGHALPARVIELAGQHPGLFEPVSCAVEVAGTQIELGSQGLRPGQKRHPTLLVDQLKRARQRGGGLAALGAQ